MCGPQVANKLKTVPLSKNTVKDRIENTLIQWPVCHSAEWATSVAEDAVLIVYMSENVAKDTWVMNPFLAKEDDVEYLYTEDELLDIQVNDLLKRFFNEHGYGFCW